MSLRDNLRISHPSPELIRVLAELAEKIVTALDEGDECSALIEQLNEIARRKDYDREYFKTLHTHSSVDDFALEAALPQPKRINDISREELIEIVRLAKETGFPLSIYYRELFDLNVPMSGASGLLDYPEEWTPGQDLDKYDPSPEELVDRALKSTNVIDRRSNL